MNTLKLTTQFKKDLKRYKHKVEVIDKLEEIFNISMLSIDYQRVTNCYF